MKGGGLKRVVKPYIASLNPYKPGKPIEEVEHELGIAKSIKLASNENPLGPSPKAVAAMREALAGVHRYPDGGSVELKAALARKLGVGVEQIILGAGSDEILELLAKAFLREEDEAVFAWPSFAMYPIVTQGAGARSVKIPLTDRFEHDLPAMLGAVGERTRIVFVCNPNNPTGTSLGARELDAFMADVPDDVIVAIDEAYFEYARRTDFPDSLKWVAQRPGTIVMRTFSKIYGLAGLRVGYGIADPELAGYLERARHPFNINRLAQIGALAALDDDAHVATSRAINAQGVAFLERALAELGLRTASTDANFLLVEVGGEGSSVYEGMLRRGVIVRPMDGFGLGGFVRITIGTSEENAVAVDALRSFLEEAR